MFFFVLARLTQKSLQPPETSSTSNQTFFNPKISNAMSKFSQADYHVYKIRLCI